MSNLAENSFHQPGLRPIGQQYRKCISQTVVQSQNISMVPASFSYVDFKAIYSSLNNKMKLSHFRVLLL
jgi:hypothetical protein